MGRQFHCSFLTRCRATPPQTTMETHDHREITPAVYAPVQRMIKAGEWFQGRDRHAMGFLETCDWPTLSALKVTADCQWTFLQTLNRAKHRQLLNLRERAKPIQRSRAWWNGKGKRLGPGALSSEGRATWRLSSDALRKMVWCEAGVNTCGGSTICGRFTISRAIICSQLLYQPDQQQKHAPFFRLMQRQLCVHPVRRADATVKRDAPRERLPCTDAHS